MQSVCFEMYGDKISAGLIFLLAKLCEAILHRYEIFIMGISQNVFMSSSTFLLPTDIIEELLTLYACRHKHTLLIMLTIRQFQPITPPPNTGIDYPPPLRAFDYPPAFWRKEDRNIAWRLQDGSATAISESWAAISGHTEACVLLVLIVLSTVLIVIAYSTPVWLLSVFIVLPVWLSFCVSCAVYVIIFLCLLCCLYDAYCHFLFNCLCVYPFAFIVLSVWYLLSLLIVLPVWFSFCAYSAVCLIIYLCLLYCLCDTFVIAYYTVCVIMFVINNHYFFILLFYWAANNH